MPIMNPSMNLTQRECMKLLRAATGMTLGRNEYGEWIVDYPRHDVRWVKDDEGCGTRYFTDCIDDAIGTARMMDKQGRCLERCEVADRIYDEEFAKALETRRAAVRGFKSWHETHRAPSH